MGRARDEFEKKPMRTSPFFPNPSSSPAASSRSAWGFAWAWRDCYRDERKNGVVRDGGGWPAHVLRLQSESRGKYAMVNGGGRTYGRSERRDGIHGPAYSTGIALGIPHGVHDGARTGAAEWAAGWEHTSYPENWAGSEGDGGDWQFLPGQLERGPTIKRRVWKHRSGIHVQTRRVKWARPDVPRQSGHQTGRGP